MHVDTLFVNMHANTFSALGGDQYRPRFLDGVPLDKCYFAGEIRKLLSHSNVKGGRHYMAQFITVREGGRETEPERDMERGGGGGDGRVGGEWGGGVH